MQQTIFTCLLFPWQNVRVVGREAMKHCILHSVLHDEITHALILVTDNDGADDSLAMVNNTRNKKRLRGYNLLNHVNRFSIWL